MSILDFAQLDDHDAVVSVDTEDSTGAEAGKMFVLPHLGAVVAGRGRSDVLRLLVYQAMRYTTFDQAADDLERAFVECHDALPEFDQAAAAAVGLSVPEIYARQFVHWGDDTYLAQEVLLVGPSARLGYLEATYIKRARPGACPEVLRKAGTVVAPALPDDAQRSPRCLLTTDTGAYRLASLQLERCAEAKRPGYGGRLLVARMKRGEVTVRDLGRLERSTAHAPTHGQSSLPH